MGKNGTADRKKDVLVSLHKSLMKELEKTNQNFDLIEQIGVEIAYLKNGVCG